jgi:DNA-binding NarL/FixJ family response regulator
MFFIFKKRNKTTKNPMQDLTIQERNIFGLLQQGKSNKEISDELSISLSTVKSHVNNIFSKMNLKSRKEILS